MFNTPTRRGFSVVPIPMSNLYEEKMSAPNNAYYVLTQAHAGLPNSVLGDERYLKLDGTNVPTADYLNWTTALTTTKPITAEKFVGWGVCPIGAILPWAKTMTSVPALPDGWLECDGSTIDDADSLMDGEDLPDLNGDNRFLRGAATSGGTGGSSTVTLTLAQLAAHTHTIPKYSTQTMKLDITGNPTWATADIGGGATGSTGSGDAHENKPPYYEVVWIMRIK